MLKWDTKSKKYHEVLRRLKLSSLMTEPTRVTVHSSSCIDHIVTNRPKMYHNAGRFRPVRSLADLCIQKKEKTSRSSKIIKCRDYRYFDALKYQNELNKLDWTLLAEIDDANVSVNIFQQMLLDMCNKHRPFRNLKLREFTPNWLNTEYLSVVDAREYWSQKF